MISLTYLPASMINIDSVLQAIKWENINNLSTGFSPNSTTYLNFWHLRHSNVTSRTLVHKQTIQISWHLYNSGIYHFQISHDNNLHLSYCTDSSSSTRVRRKYIKSYSCLIMYLTFFFIFPNILVVESLKTVWSWRGFGCGVCIFWNQLCLSV